MKETEPRLNDAHAETWVIRCRADVGRRARIFSEVRPPSMGFTIPSFHMMGISAAPTASWTHAVSL